MAAVYRSIQAFSRRHPISRGMLAYGTLWPTSNFCQQYFLRDKIDLTETTRYAVFGGFYTAPIVHGWIKILVYFIPGQTLKAAMAKAMLDQIIYAPFAITTFLFGMSLLEGKTDWEEMKLEWWQKYLTMHKASLCIWPLAQTINFTVIKERNRVPFMATVSFFWAIWLSYAKHLALKRGQTADGK